MLNNIIKNKGYTLVEILVTMSLFTVLTLMSGNYIITGFKATTFEKEQSEAIANARKILKALEVEVRGAINSEQGAYPITLIDNDEFIFYSDIDNDGQSEKIRYYSNDLLLMKEVTEPGATNEYSGAPVSSIASEYLNNQDEDVFTFYDSDYNSTLTINNVRLVKIILKINVTPAVAPNDFYVETDVTLRNLKSNL